MTHIVEDCSNDNVTPLCYEWNNGGVVEKVTAYAKLDKQSNFVEWIVLEGVSPPDLSIPSILKQCDILAAECECDERPKAAGDYYSIVEQGVKRPAYLLPKTANDAADYVNNGTVTMSLGGKDVQVSHNTIVDTGGVIEHKLTSYNYTGLLNKMLDSNFTSSNSQVSLGLFTNLNTGAVFTTTFDFNLGDFDDLVVAYTDLENVSIKTEVFDINGNLIPLVSGNTYLCTSQGLTVPINRRYVTQRDSTSITFIEPPLVGSINDDAGVIELDSTIMADAVRIVSTCEQVIPIPNFGDGIETTIGTKNLYTNEFGKLLLGGCKSDGSPIGVGDTLHLKVFKKPEFGVFSLSSSGSVLWGDTAALESILSAASIISGTSTWTNGVYEGGTYDFTSEYKIELSVEQSSLPGVFSYIKTIKF